MLFFTAQIVDAQRYFQPLGRMYDLDMQHRLLRDSSVQESFSAVKPVLIPVRTPLCPEKEPQKWNKWMRQHFFDDDFLTFCSDLHSITINPILHFQRTYHRDDKGDDRTYFLNTRGFDVFGRLGERVYFKSEFYENQARFTNYEDKVINAMKGIPGQGFGKAFNKDGKDWAMVFGSVSVDVNKYMTFTLGNGKNSVGSGYRSVILSDLSFNYPYLRSDFKFGKFYYYVLWGYMQASSWKYFTTAESKYKFASYHVGGWKPSPKLELSVIEGIMWKNTDDNGVYKYSPNGLMFVPALGLPLAVNGFNDGNRVQIGYDVNYSPLHNIKVYHQLNYQGADKEGNKLRGFQFGAHWFDLLFGLVPDLKSHLQYEYNDSRIADGLDASDFWNYGYPLTALNVVENDVRENILAADIEYKRVMIDVMYQKSQKAERKTLTLRYMLNPKTKWNIYVQLYDRNVDYDKYKYDNTFLMVGMQICPQNFYFDF